jgi:hypothetical protein
LLSRTDWIVAIAVSSRSAISRLVVSSRRRARGLAVQIGGKPRAIHAERLHLGRKRSLAAIGLAPALDGGIKPIEGLRQTLDRGIDCALLVHCNTAIAINRI